MYWKKKPLKTLSNCVTLTFDFLDLRFSR